MYVCVGGGGVNFLFTEMINYFFDMLECIRVMKAGANVAIFYTTYVTDFLQL